MVAQTFNLGTQMTIKKILALIGGAITLDEKPLNEEKCRWIVLPKEVTSFS